MPMGMQQVLTLSLVLAAANCSNSSVNTMSFPSWQMQPGKITQRGITNWTGNLGVGCTTVCVRGSYQLLP